MALLEDLIADVEDPRLRAELAAEARDLKQRTSFGLVFERHIPESVVLPSKIGVLAGDEVRLRGDPGDERRLRVSDLNGEAATVVDSEGGTEHVAVDDLAVVKDFSEPVYPTLRPDGSVERGGDRPPHLVIEGENYHALQLLAFTHARQADCIYIDPPYNTGAPDWKYNNRYVDESDAWRHSKWLSFMEKRLRLAKQLLKPDGVLIVTIDEHEVHHLGVLLEQVFPESRSIQMVSSLINPALQSRPGGFGRSDEYIFFVMHGGAAPKRTLLSRDWVSDKGRTFTGTARWDLLRRSGTSATRGDSPGGFYPIYVEPEGPTFRAIGEALPKDVSAAPPFQGAVAVLPIRKDGSEGRWQVSPQTLRQYLDQGRVRIGGSEEDGFVIYYLKGGEYDKVLNGEYPVSGRNVDGSLRIGEGEGAEVVAVPATQWRIPSHDATQYGSRLLLKFLPRGQFPFPKSLYAVQDVLSFFVGAKPDALVIDFFAGSGTTLHATCLLNAEDDGRRRCILVTNNEVEDKLARKLAREGHFPGDPEFEKHGIFEAATRPRCEAAISGVRADGQPVPGTYLDGRPFTEGFEENCEFFRLDYLNPDRVELGLEVERVHPLLWLLAAGKGKRPEKVSSGEPFTVVHESGYAVLFEPSAAAALIEAVGDAPEVAHVFVFTESEQIHSQVSAAFGPDRKAHMLPRDYLRRFRSEVALRP